VKLEGSLDAFSLPDIFALLSMTKKTGGLHLRRAGAHGVVWLTTGSLTGGASDIARQTLARRLVGSTQVSDDALSAAVDAARADGDLGVVRALQQSGTVDEGVLHEVVSEQIIDTVFDLLRWTEGDFAFSLDEPNPDDVGVSLGVDEVVTEARRRLEAWGGVAAAVPSPQTVLSLATSLDDDTTVGRDDWALLALVDGRRSVAELVGLCGRGEFAVVSRLADLVGRGLLRTDAADGVEALMRRHSVLAQLETAEPVEAVEAAEPAAAEPDPEELTEEPVVAATPRRVETLVDAQRGRPVAAPAVPAQPGERTHVTPARPEPFLPKRQPEHAEMPLNGSPLAAVAGSAAVAASPATHIERDPSVNKSLLLRLIAGVRGL
jgi:hypothetical protein